jgi:hypothetical protein
MTALSPSSWAKSKQDKKLAASLLLSWLAYSSALVVEAVRSNETSADFMPKYMALHPSI